MTRTALLTASLALVGVTALGCSGGGGDGAPTDASEEDFCSTLNSVFEDVGDLADEGSQEEAIKAIKLWGKDMARVGTPEDISQEARDGFELMVRQVKGIEDASSEGLAALDDDLSESDKAASEALDQYTTDTCGEPELPQLPEEPAPPEESPTE